MRYATWCCIALVAGFAAQVSAEVDLLGPSCDQIDVAYVQHGELHYVQLKRGTGERSRPFILSKADLPSAGPETQITHAEVIAVNVPEEIGTRLLNAFARLSLSSRSAGYGYYAEPPLDGVHNYGLISCDGEMVVACAISEWAVSPQLNDSLKIAWWLQLVNATIKGVFEQTAPTSRNVVSVGLRGLLHRLPNALEIPVCGYGEVAEWEGKKTIDASELLRSAIALGLIYGGLISQPGAAPERELRLALVERYSVEFKGAKVRTLLLGFLGDVDSDVRFNAAYRLAGLVDPMHPEVRRALETYLEEETNPDRKRLVETSITEMERPVPRSQAPR